jgi:outer membrane assembly lipoprotein YfiO
MLRALCLTAAILCLPSLLLAQDTSWELRAGRWQQVDNPTTAPIGDETLDRAEAMLQNKQYESARRVLISWIKSKQPKKDTTAQPSQLLAPTPNRDRAVYLLGMANFHTGNRLMAFYNFDELLDYYPASRYFYPALEQQYEIADAYLRGLKRKFLGFPILSADTEAIEMLYRIQQRAPGSPIAEQALLRTADYYYASSQFDVAADAYAAYIRSYPRSPYQARVRLRQAFSALAQFRGVRFDATPVIDARQQLSDLATAFPRVAEEENISAILRRIDTSLARKIYATADFYRRTNKPRAAVYYYRYLQRTFPESPEAASAGRALERMPQWALEAVESTNIAPATRPTTTPASDLIVPRATSTGGISR